MGVSTSIPLEIVERIAEELAGDKAALRSCSLASQSLLLPARRHLFSAINLRSDVHYASFTSIFFNNPGIAIYIRSLSITNGDYSMRRRLRIDNVFERADSLSTIINAICPYICAFSYSDFMDVDDILLFQYMTTNLQNAFLKMFSSPNLREICFHMCPSFPLPYLSHCPQITKLAIFRSCNKERQNEPGVSLSTVSRQARCSLQTLSLGDEKSAASVVQLFNLSSLHTLFIRNNVTLDTAVTLISGAQQSLEDLSWQAIFHDFEPRSTDLSNVAFDIPNLKCLYVTNISSVGNGYLSCISALLSGGSRVIDRALETIYLQLQLKNGHDALYTDIWQMLEDSLNHPRYRRLQQVTISLDLDKSSGNNVENGWHLVRQMPALYSKSILKLWWNGVLLPDTPGSE